MCDCGLTEGVHWFADPLHAPDIWQIAESPEQAEASLRTWAGKVVRIGHRYIELRRAAAKVLSTRVLDMRRLCDTPELLALARDSVTID